MSATIKSPNGTAKSERRCFADLNRKFRGDPEFCVATVDYGTTHCSVDYTLYPGNFSKEQRVLVRLDEFKDVGRVPNSILFNHYGKKIAFGYQARDKYSRISDVQRKKFFYFEHVKKTFQHQKVDRNTEVVADNGTKFFLLDVIAHTLCYLKKKVMSSLAGAMRPELHIDWVITVPAIWDAAGKQMMREAGYKAGLCSDDDENIPDLTEAIGINTPTKVEYPDRLSLALEPESAAIHCQQEAKNAHKESNCYIVVDIGGGTVDIACHQIVAGFTEERHPAHGNDWGGTRINEQFQHFLEELVDDDGLNHYVGRLANNQEKNKAHLRELLYTRFEREKIRFGEDRFKDDTEEYVVEFHGTFWSQYGEKLMATVIERNDRNDMSVMVEEDERQLRITHEQMANFFKPALQGISNLLLGLLSKDVGRASDTIFWVGGLGGCEYLQQKLQENIIREFGARKYRFFTPPQPELAVVRGATAFRCKPSILRTRKADATYGICCVTSFDRSIHNPVYKVWSNDQQVYKCHNLFSAFVEEGESINTYEAFVQSYSPSKYNQTDMTIEIYSSPKKSVWYITDQGAQKLGDLRLELEGVGLHRSVEVTFDITHTEIQVRAYQKPEGKEVKAVVDFL